MMPEKYLPDGVVLGGGVITTGGTTILSPAAGQSLNVAPLNNIAEILSSNNGSSHNIAEILMQVVFCTNDTSIKLECGIFVFAVKKKS
jgi:hypothetical protein